MDYYLGGYLLLHCLPVDMPGHPQNGKPLLTCSTCINESLLDVWSYSWGSDDESTLYDASTTLYQHVESTFGIDSLVREKIQIWVDKHDSDIGWLGVFMNAQTAIDYKQTFFKHVQNCYLLALYFSDIDAQKFITRWQPQSKQDGILGIPQRLIRYQPEYADPRERLFGYDIVGLDIGGEFHSSHCHYLGETLREKFALNLNHHGLYDAIPDWQPVIDYMNDETTGCEPVPWGIAKIKQVIF